MRRYPRQFAEWGLVGGGVWLGATGVRRHEWLPGAAGGAGERRLSLECAIQAVCSQLSRSTVAACTREWWKAGHPYMYCSG